jgi:titin
VNLKGTVMPDHVKLEWAPPDFTGGLELKDYSLYRSVDGGPLELLARVLHLLVSYVDTDVEDTVTYTYVLASSNERGESKDNPSVTVRMTGVSTPPRDLDHTYGDRFIEITWAEPEELFDLPIMRYFVYRENGDGEFKMVGVVKPSELVYRDRTVEVGVTYTYRVVAENAKGMSDPSPELVAMTMVRPDPPEAVKAKAHDRFVRITWEAPPFDGASPITSYRVHLVDDEEGTMLLGDVYAAGVADPALVYLHEVEYDGVARKYHVTAVNAEGESDPSDVALTALYRPPSPPRSVEAEWGDGQVSISWDVPQDDGGSPVGSYLLYRRLTGENISQEVALVPSGTLAHVDDTVANGVSYTYWLIARNLAGDSNSSSEVTSMPAGPPTAPQGLETEGRNGSVIVRWEPPSWNGGLPLIGYRLYLLSEGMNREVLASFGPDGREFEHGDLVNGEAYRYAVQAMSPAGASELSEVVEGMPTGAPSAPQALIAVWMDGMVYVTWSSPASDGGAPLTGFRVRRADWEIGNWTDVPALVMVFSDEDVEHNTTYNYTVYAVNDVGGGPLVRITITTPPPESEQDDDPTAIWPWLVLGVSMAVLAAAVLYWRRPKVDSLEIYGDEEG